MDALIKTNNVAREYHNPRVADLGGSMAVTKRQTNRNKGG